MPEGGESSDLWCEQSPAPPQSPPPKKIKNIYICETQ